MDDIALEQFTVRLAKWPAEQAVIRKIREQVFVQEQKVPVEIEWDNQDAAAMHFLAIHRDGEAVATARLLPTGQLGRMAVLSPWRNHGLGNLVLTTVLQWANATQLAIYCHAQVKAKSFYLRAGFTTEGDEFLEAGIKHQTMRYQNPLTDA